MMNTKRLINMASTASFGIRSAVSSPSREESTAEVDQFCSSSTSALPSKGHIFIHTIDGKRFMIPLKYLNSNIFMELLRISEDEFGFRGDGPIMLACDGVCMEYIVSLLHSRVSRDVEKALITSIANKRRCMDPFPIQKQQLIVFGFQHVIRL